MIAFFSHFQRQKLEFNNSDDDDDSPEKEDEKPVVVVLQSGDLTAEEVEKLQKIQEGRKFFKLPGWIASVLS